MRFPKLNCVFQPPFGIGADSKPKAMSGIFLFMIRDFYAHVSYIRDSSIDNGYTGDAVVTAYGYKRWRIVFRKACMAGVGNDNHTWFGKIATTKASDPL